MKAEAAGTVVPMKRVLVADDNRQFAELLRVTLENAGYEVVTAYSGIAAVSVAGGAPVDVAVLDVLLPGVSGDLRAGLHVILVREKRRRARARLDEHLHAALDHL